MAGTRLIRQEESDKDMAVISVIISVYNVRHYLEKCIDSVLKQSFPDYEVILVDDGSTDGSAEICDEYTGRYNRIRVIHKENGGVASARNSGVAAAACEWITFVDADDWIDEYYLEVLYRLTETKADLVISGGINIPEGKEPGRKNKRREAADAGFERLSKAEAYKRMLLCEHNMSVTAWGKLYRAGLLKEVIYPEGEICEDSKVIGEIVENSGSIVCTMYKGYYYVRRKGSLMHRPMTEEYRKCTGNAKELWDFIRERYPETEYAARIFYYMNCIQLLNYMVLDAKESYMEECRKIRREILGSLFFLILSRHTKQREKGAVLCLLFGITGYKKMWKLYLRLTGKDSGRMMP